MTGPSGGNGSGGSPRVGRARTIVARRRSESRSRGGGERSGTTSRSSSGNDSGGAPTGNDYSLNPFQCLDAAAASASAGGSKGGRDGVRMVRGSYSPPRSRGGGRSRSSSASRNIRSRGPPAIQYADSMTSEATPVHANNRYQNSVNAAQYGNHNHNRRYNDKDGDPQRDGDVDYVDNDNCNDNADDDYKYNDNCNDNYNNEGNDDDHGANARGRTRNVMHDLLPNHSLVDDSSTFADETTTHAEAPPGSPRSCGGGAIGSSSGGCGINGNSGGAGGPSGGRSGGGSSSGTNSNGNSNGNSPANSGSGSGSGSGSKEAYTRIMHQYLVQSRTNPLTKRAAASVIVEAATTATATTTATAPTGRDTTARSRPSSSRPSPPRPSPLPPLDPSSSQNPTNSRLRSLLSSGLASSASAKNNANTNSSKDNPKDGGGGGDDATTEDMTNSYPISNDGASTISSLSSGSGRRAAYRSLVHFLPSLLPMPPPPSSSSSPPPPPPPQASQPSDQQQPAAGGESLHDLNVSGISYQSSQTGGTARIDGRFHGNGSASFRDRPTPVRSGSRPRDQVGLDPDGPILGRRAKVQGGDEEGAATATAINEKRSPQCNQQRYDDSDDSETLGSLVTAEEEDGDNDTHADSAAAGFYPVGRMQQQQQEQPYQRQSQVQKRSDDSVGSSNVARDILSKYGQGKGGNNVTKPTERASSDPPVDATSTSAGSSLPRQSPNGTRHSASLRMKARSRSPASRQSHPQCSPTASKSDSHFANGGKNQGPGPDPVPSSSDPSSSVTNPSDRGVGAKQGGIAARIAMFEKNNASTPPSTPPKPRTNTKRWTPPNDIPNPRVQPGAPSPTSKEATSSSIDDESIADASFASRASSIPFDEKIDRGMRAAVSTVSTTSPIPEQKELVEEEDNDDGWRERMITGQRHVAPKDTTVSSGNPNSVGSSDQSRSVSPRKPNWQRAASSPDRHGNLPEGEPQDKTDTNEQPLAAQNRGARARLARHRLRQRSKSPQKAEVQAQAEGPPSDARSSEEETSRATTKSIFSPPVSGNRVRWSTSFEDASEEGCVDDFDEIMMREIDEAMMAHQRSDPRDIDPNGNQSDEGEQSPGTSNSRSRAHAALQSRRRNQARQNQETQQAPPAVSSSTMPLHQQSHMPVRAFADAPEDEEDELDPAESFPPGEPSSSGGRLGIETTNYGRGDEIDHTAGSDFDNGNGGDAFSETMHSDTFDVDVRPHDFGSEDDEDVNGMEDVPKTTINSMPESRQMSTRRSLSTSCVISINDLELFGARELSLSSVPNIEPTVNSEGLVSSALRDAVRSEEARLLRQRCVDFVSFRRESGHDSEQIGGNPLIHLDDILADVVIIQEIALDKLELGDYDGAMSSFMSIVTKCEDGTYTFADERVQDELTGTIMHNIAVIHMQLGVFDITPQLWDEACMTRRDSNPELGIFQHSVATSLNEMGVSLFACGNYEKAIQAFADTIYVRQEIHGMDNAPLAQAINNIGVVHFAMDSIDQSLEAFDEALQVYRLAMLAENEGSASHDESDVADGSGAQTLLLGIATTLSNVAYARATQGAYAEAREALGEAIEIQEAVLDSNNSRIQKSLALLGKIPSLDDVTGRSTTSSFAPQALSSAAFDPFDSMEV